MGDRFRLKAVAEEFGVSTTKISKIQGEIDYGGCRSIDDFFRNKEKINARSRPYGGEGY